MDGQGQSHTGQLHLATRPLPTPHQSWHQEGNVFIKKGYIFSRLLKSSVFLFPL